jgi:hypothetical protein
MRAISFIAMSLAVLVSGAASAQNWKSSSAVDSEDRWGACYKETRLIYRTRNMSEEQYRAMIKEARKVHMQTCMARATSPRPIVAAEVTGRRLPSIIAGWSANP